MAGPYGMMRVIRGMAGRFGLSLDDLDETKNDKGIKNVHKFHLQTLMASSGISFEDMVQVYKGIYVPLGVWKRKPEKYPYIDIFTSLRNYRYNKNNNNSRDQDYDYTNPNTKFENLKPNNCGDRNNRQCLDRGDEKVDRKWKKSKSKKDELESDYSRSRRRKKSKRKRNGRRKSSRKGRRSVSSSESESEDSSDDDSEEEDRTRRKKKRRSSKRKTSSSKRKRRRSESESENSSDDSEEEDKRRRKKKKLKRRSSKRKSSSRKRRSESESSERSSDDFDEDIGSNEDAKVDNELLVFKKMIESRMKAISVETGCSRTNMNMVVHPPSPLATSGDKHADDKLDDDDVVPTLANAAVVAGVPAAVLLRQLSNKRLRRSLSV